MYTYDHDGFYVSMKRQMVEWGLASFNPRPCLWPQALSNQFLPSYLDGCISLAGSLSLPDVLQPRLLLGLQQPLQLLLLLHIQIIHKLLGPQKIMIRVFKPRNHRLTNQQPIHTFRTIILIWNQERRLEFPPSDDPLQILAVDDILPDHEGIDAETTFRIPWLVHVYNHVDAAALVQVVHCEAAVAVEIADRGFRRHQVVDAGAGPASLGGVDFICGVAEEGEVLEWVGDHSLVAVCFAKVSPFDVWLKF